MKSAFKASGTCTPKSSADLGTFADVGLAPTWKRAGYIIKHSVRPGVYGFSEVSREAAWTDAIGNIETGSELYSLTAFEETSKFGDWYVSLTSDCSNLDFVGQSLASRRLDAEASFQEIIRERSEAGCGNMLIASREVQQ